MESAMQLFYPNQSVIGSQGSYSQPSDNQWIGNTKDTWSHESDGRDSKFFVRDYGDFDPDIDPDDKDPLFDPFVWAIDKEYGNNGAPEIDCNNKSIKSSKSQSEYKLEIKIAKDSIEYKVNPIENRWFAKQYLYKRLKEEPVMLTYDPVFVKAEKELKGSNIDKLYEYNLLLNDTDKANDVQLNSINNSIVPENLIEENHKTVNRIYLESFAAGIDSLSPIQMTELTYIAEQCPYTSGSSVYGARIMLRMIDDELEFIHECEETKGSAKTSKHILSNNDINEKADSFVNVYPNPAKDELIIECGSCINGADFEIYNMIGETMRTEKINEDKIIISLENIEGGIYMYKIIREGKAITKDKLVIIR